MKKLFLLLACFFTCCLGGTETMFLLIRHGETDWNHEKRVQGHTDIPLNETGRAQAKILADKMAVVHPDVTVIYSSDLNRAVATAEETAKKLHLDVKQSVLLREIYCGEAEGLTFAEREAKWGHLEKELNAKYPIRQDRWNYQSVPKAETWNALLERTRSEIIKIAKLHPGQKIAIFAHSRVIKTLICESIDSEDVAYFPNCAVSHFTYSDETPDQLKFIKAESLIED